MVLAFAGLSTITKFFCIYCFYFGCKNTLATSIHQINLPFFPFPLIL